jgi:hypothetical protein
MHRRTQVRWLLGDVGKGGDGVHRRAHLDVGLDQGRELGVVGVEAGRLEGGSDIAEASEMGSGMGGFGEMTGEPMAHQ